MSDEEGKLFVGGLSWETNNAYGEVVEALVMKNPETGNSKGFGFVTFTDPQCVRRALKVRNHQLDGRTIDPKECNPKSAARAKKEFKHSNAPKIFLGGLPANVTETGLRDFFSKYGKVTEVIIMYDQEKKKSRGFGFLSLESEESINKLVGEHYVNINGKQVEIKRAEPQKANTSNSGKANHNQDSSTRVENGNNNQNNGQNSATVTAATATATIPVPGMPAIPCFAMTPWGVFPATPIIPPINAVIPPPPPAVAATAPPNYQNAWNSTASAAATAAVLAATAAASNPPPPPPNTWPPGYATPAGYPQATWPTFCHQLPPPPVPQPANRTAHTVISVQPPASAYLPPQVNTDTRNVSLASGGGLVSPPIIKQDIPSYSPETGNYSRSIAYSNNHHTSYSHGHNSQGYSSHGNGYHSSTYQSMSPHVPIPSPSSHHTEPPPSHRYNANNPVQYGSRISNQSTPGYHPYRRA